MRYFNLIGALAALIVILSGFLTWVHIPGTAIEVGGYFSEGTRFGKPALMNAFMSAIAFVLFLVPKIWAKRANLFFTGFNLAWAIRNFILLSICHAGDCPAKAPGLYIYAVASVIEIIMAAFPHLPLEEKQAKI